MEQNNTKSNLYSHENLKFRIQKRIGYIFSFYIIFLIIINTFNELYIFGGLVFLRSIIFKIIMLFEAVIFFWTTKKGLPKVKRFLQTILILLNGLLTLFSDITQIYFGLSFLIFGSLLLLQYDLFEYKFINYIIFIALLLVSAVFIYNFYFQESPSSGGLLSEVEQLKDPIKLIVYKTISIISRTTFIALFLILFPSIYIDQANFFKTLNELVVKEKESLASFANIGMMLNSTIHNFNNKIVTFLSSEYIITSTINRYKDLLDPKDYDKIINTCQMVKHASDEMTLMIKDIRNLIKSKTNQQLQTYELNKIMEEIVKQFELSYEKKQIEFKLIKESDPIFIRGNSIHFIQVIENLIKNAIESSGNPKIIINTGAEPLPFIEIKDNGVGIPFCFNCKKRICLDCKEFQIGKTTKKEGSGTGMVYVQNTLKDMKAKMQIESEKDKGTSITITFTETATKKLEEIEKIYLDKEEQAFSGS